MCHGKYRALINKSEIKGCSISACSGRKAGTPLRVNIGVTLVKYQNN